MTVVGAGGAVIRAFQFKETFNRDYKKLTNELKAKFQEQSRKLLGENRNGTINFEKLKGYSRPNIYTIHIEGNYKASCELVGDIIIFRRIGPHDRIDRAP